MNLVMTGKQLELTEYLKGLVAHELAFLENLLPKDKTVTVTLESKPVQKATILFYHENEVVKLSDTGTDIYVVFPNLAKKLEKKLRGARKMKRTLQMGKENAKNFVPMSQEDTDELDTPMVTKRKHFEMKPMSEAEAILQTKKLGHPQFIFANSELNGRICLLYTRKDSTFGVIETTF